MRITEKTAAFLLNIVWNKIEDAKVHASDDGTYADLLRAEKELLDIVVK